MRPSNDLILKVEKTLNKSLDCEQSLTVFFFAKLLHAKPKHTSEKRGEKRGRKPEKKK